VNRAIFFLALVVGATLVMFLGGCGGPGSETVTTVAPSATTEVTLPSDQLAALEARVQSWAGLIGSIQDSGADMTAEIAAYLWPRENAQARAAEYQQMWSAAPGSSEVIARRDFDRIVRVSADGAEGHAVVLVMNKLTGWDGTLTSSLEAVTWSMQDGQWYRTTSFWVPTPTQGARQSLDKTVRVDAMTWSPLAVEQVHSLTTGAGQAAEGRVFLVVTMYVANAGEDPSTPADYSLRLYDLSGERLRTAEVFDALLPGSKRAREVVLDSGMEVQLTYCFDAPADLDVTGLEYEVVAGD
jgi:hypothetical protein